MKIFKRVCLGRLVGLVLLTCLSAAWAVAQTPAATPLPVVIRPASSASLRQETFELVWQTVNKTFHDPNFNGVDWKAMHDRYAPRVAAATSDAELYPLLQMMVNELHQSHFWVIAPEAIPKLRPKPRTSTPDNPGEENSEDTAESEPESALDLIKEDLADRLSTGIGIDVRVVNRR